MRNYERCISVSETLRSMGACGDFSRGRGDIRHKTHHHMRALRLHLRAIGASLDDHLLVAHRRAARVVVRRFF